MSVLHKLKWIPFLSQQWTLYLLQHVHLFSRCLTCILRLSPCSPHFQWEQRNIFTVGIILWRVCSWGWCISSMLQNNEWLLFHRASQWKRIPLSWEGRWARASCFMLSWIFWWQIMPNSCYSMTDYWGKRQLWKYPCQGKPLAINPLLCVSL